MKSLITEKYIPNGLITAILLIIIISIFFWNYISPWDKGSWGNLLSGIAALFNAVLLFLTLKRQDRSFTQERFEITFFNLLENHKKITEEIEQTTCDIHEIQTQPLRYIGRKCFSFAIKECADISKALSTERYYGFLEGNEKIEEEAIERKHDNITNDPYIEKENNEKLSEFYSLCRHKFFNKKYNITHECYNRARELIGQQKLNINEAAYRLFLRRHHDTFNFYFRSLKQLLSFTNDDCPQYIASAKYVKIIISQMSPDEQRLAYYYSLYDNTFKQVFDKCKAQQYMNINF